ncbi:SIMPL domain-containing protein [Hymenobacter weizhouensis]|uniref:SIMPL domain-containing protein n=1 Tax=Hymenobacter sp. YIM 151500-1 TaxID=2987689 RepID=UPI002227EC1B|nr:SIMPL domain-containing protein [Hymenobacter sp. YIM 151500-1]UYZ63130.1 SIMPL domain-containing protein [Hymenobacter sp. YIM 151500-1]
MRGSATRELAPETAELLLTYRAQDQVRNADRAREQQDRLLAVLNEYRIEPARLVVYNLMASGSGWSKTTNSTVYLTTQYKLTLDKPAIINELLPKLVQTGADEVVVSNLLSSRLAAFRLEVASLALADARTKAQHIVQQAGLKLAGIRTIAEVLPAGPAAPLIPERSRYRMLTFGSAASVGADAADVVNPVNPRAIRVQVAFDVEYEVQ